jgi:hypothetical protein
MVILILILILILLLSREATFPVLIKIPEIKLAENKARRKHVYRNQPTKAE